MSRKQKQYHFIYKTTDTRNGNFYIGMHSTDNLNDGYVGSGERIKNIKYKYGKDIFIVEKLEFLPDRESLKKREQEIVNSDLLKEDKCMNLKEGGDGGFNFTKEELKEFSKKGNKKHVENLKIDEFKKNYSENVSKGVKKYLETHDHFWLGKKHTNDTIIKMKKPKNVGVNNPQFGTCWITNGVKNKKIKNYETIPENWYKGRTFILNS